MRKKVLHILAGMTRGGCEGNALCMVMQTPDCEHHVLVLNHAGEMSGEFLAAGAQMHYLGLPSRIPWMLSGRIRQEVTAIRPDGAIHWHGMVMLPQILNALADFGMRVLVHGGNPACGLPPSVDRRYRWLECWLGRRAKAIYVCCTSYVAESFKSSRYLRSFPTAVVPNGVKEVIGPAHVTRELARDRLVTLGMVARLDTIKDHATLLHALPQVLKFYPNAMLELAGDGALRESLQALAVSLGIADQVRFLGTVTDVYAAMKRWDIFVYATTEQEGLGNALAEAMMLGMPCVATAIGPVTEVAGTPPAVLLVDPRNPDAMAKGILQVIDDSVLLKSLAVQARERALTEFRAAVFAQRYLDLLFS